MLDPLNPTLAPTSKIQKTLIHFLLSYWNRIRKNPATDVTSLPHHRIASMVNPWPSVSRRDKITQCRDEGITLEMVVKGDRWKVLCHCYKDPTIDGSNGSSKCERSYGLEQQRPGRQNGAWNGGSMCRRLLKSSNKCDTLHVRRSGAAEITYTTEQPGSQNVKTKFPKGLNGLNWKDGFRDVASVFDSFLPSVFYWINLAELFGKVWIWQKP